MLGHMKSKHKTIDISGKEKKANSESEKVVVINLESKKIYVLNDEDADESLPKQSKIDDLFQNRQKYS
uniref:Uncharacterized protein n=1 Tax=Romanomermis culicivorax TaxID=13658 RepID=A0A915KKG4_ROMCU